VKNQNKGAGRGGIGCRRMFTWGSACEIVYGKRKLGIRKSTDKRAAPQGLLSGSMRKKIGSRVVQVWGPFFNEGKEGLSKEDHEEDSGRGGKEGKTNCLGYLRDIGWRIAKDKKENASNKERSNDKE